MKQIEYSLTIEPFISRLPGMIPSIDVNDENKNIVYFGELKKYKTENDEFGSTYSSNYGLIPINIQVSGISGDSIDNFLIGENFALSNSSNGDVTRISYQTLKEIYHFLNDYDFLLHSTGSCNRIYESAEDYFYNETKYGKNTKLYYYGDLEFYKGLDKKYNRFGGAHTLDYMNTHFFPSVNIESIVGDDNKKGIDTWGVKKLYYPDLLYWQKWMNQRWLKYKDKECSDTEDCCDCDRFKQRGGKAALDKIAGAINSIKGVILRDNQIYSSFTQENWEELTRGERPTTPIIPHINFDLQISEETNINGEQTNLLEEWVPGRDYSKTRSSDGSTFIVNGGKSNINVSSGGDSIVVKVISKDGNEGLMDGVQHIDGGTVVSYKGEVYIIKGNYNGSNYDELYKEVLFGNEKYNLWNGSNTYKEHQEEQWNDYSASFKKNIKDIQEIEKTTYAYDKMGKIITDPSIGNKNVVDDLRLSDQYKYYDNNGLGYALIFGTPYIIEKKEYLEDNRNSFVSGRTYQEHYSNINTPYIIIDGSIIYAERDNGKWVYNICGNELQRKTSNIVNYNGTTYTINSGKKVEIDGCNHDIVTGYIDIDDEYYYTKDICVDGRKDIALFRHNGRGDLELSGKVANLYKNGVMFICYQTNIYRLDVITGYTDSKLDLFVQNAYEDNVGNKFGCLDVQRNPKDNELLPLPFIPGYCPKVEKSDMVEDEQYPYYGNYLKEFTIYLDEGENSLPTLDNDKLSIWRPISGKTVSAVERGNDSIEIINDLIEAYNDEMNEESPNYNKDIKVTNNLRCRFTYYTNVSLDVNKESGTINLIEKDGKLVENGIKYIEDVALIKVVKEFYDDVNSEPYPIFYYEWKGKKETTISEQYNSEITSSLVRFETKRPSFDDKWNKEWFSEKYGFDSSMRQIASPSLSLEYQQDIAFRENVEANISIDRGYTSAFEKMLKLGEVSSMEALEQYSNGYFNLTQNT